LQADTPCRGLQERTLAAKIVATATMRRPTTGTLVLFVGLGDLLFTVVLFAAQLADIGKNGVFGVVMFDERAGANAAALWFAMKRGMLVVVGLTARAYERVGRALPPAPGWALAALGVAGAIVAPISGFWAYIALGALWVHDARH
jgi:hypothetical protein